MRNLRNYYRILHVERDAPAAVIKGSYRTLMQTLRHHPDLGGDAWNAQLLNEAMATLGDPVARARYDATLADHPSGSSLRDASAGGDRHGQAGVRADTGPPDPDADGVDPRGDGTDDVGLGGANGGATGGASRAEHTRGDGPGRDPSPDDRSPRHASPAAPVVPVAATAPARRCPFCERVATTPADTSVGGYAVPTACGGCGGPVRAPRVGTGADDATERRRSPRLEHETAATLRRRSRAPEGAEDVTVLELSGSGCVLEAAAPIPVGEIVLLHGHALSAIGTVRSCAVSGHASRRRIALAFLTVDLHAPAGSFVSRTV